MPEPGRAPIGTPKDITINIDAQYHCVPKHGAVLNQGTVTFHVAANDGCMVYTDPADAFVDEPAEGCLTLVKGDNTFTVAVEDTTINYCACANGGTCDPDDPRDDGGNTIKVDSSMGG